MLFLNYLAGVRNGKKNRSTSPRAQMKCKMGQLLCNHTFCFLHCDLSAIFIKHGFRFGSQVLSRASFAFRVEFDPSSSDQCSAPTNSSRGSPTSRSARSSLTESSHQKFAGRFFFSGNFSSTSVMTFLLHF